jgi:hypothetical protein
MNELPGPMFILGRDEEGTPSSLGHEESVVRRLFIGPEANGDALLLQGVEQEIRLEAIPEGVQSHPRRFRYITFLVHINHRKKLRHGSSQINTDNTRTTTYVQLSRLVTGTRICTDQYKTIFRVRLHP